MKKLVPLVLALTLLVGAITLTAPRAVNAQSAGLVSSVLNRMERNRQSLRSLKASLSMEKYNAQLRDSELYRASSFMYRAADEMRQFASSGKNRSTKFWRFPMGSTLCFDRDSTWPTRAARNPARIRLGAFWK